MEVKRSVVFGLELGHFLDILGHASSFVSTCVVRSSRSVRCVHAVAYVVLIRVRKVLITLTQMRTRCQMLLYQRHVLLPEQCFV